MTLLLWARFGLLAALVAVITTIGWAVMRDRE